MKLMFNGEEVLGGGTGGGAGIPTGGIIIWSGAADAVPSGWALCDGENGTPDLRDRFVLGAGTVHPVGETGGEEEITLTAEQMPEHSHTFSQTLAADSGGIRVNLGTYTTAVGYTPSGLRTTLETGSSHPHSNMPPYYALCYIMKT